MDLPIEIVSGSLNPDFSNEGEYSIEFKDAQFSYPTKLDVKVIKNLNLKIKRGESVALVGSSGSGKSSIVNLILRFYDLNSGEIKISG